MSDQWPTWATQPVEVVGHDPTWADRADDLARSVAGALGSLLEGHVEHVGSTAVPGLDAKPILDLMAPVVDVDDTTDADAVLAREGWELVPPELDGRPWRRMYVLPDDDRRVAHLHLVEPDHPQWRDTLRFRDALRGDPDLVAAYAALKREAAVEHHDDREAYTYAKSRFVFEVLAADAE